MATRAHSKCPPPPFGTLAGTPLVCNSSRIQDAFYFLVFGLHLRGSTIYFVHHFLHLVARCVCSQLPGFGHSAAVLFSFVEDYALMTSTPFCFCASLIWYGLLFLFLLSWVFSLRFLLFLLPSSGDLSSRLLATKLGFGHSAAAVRLSEDSNGSRHDILNDGNDNDTVSVLQRIIMTSARNISGFGFSAAVVWFCVGRSGAFSASTL